MRMLGKVLKSACSSPIDKYICVVLIVAIISVSVAVYVDSFTTKLVFWFFAVYTLQLFAKKYEILGTEGPLSKLLEALVERIKKGTGS